MAWPKVGWNPATVGLSYGALACASLLFTRFGAQVESIWVSNALLAAALVTQSRKNWPLIILAAAVGHVAAHVIGRDAPAYAAAALISDMSEATILASLLSWRPSAVAFQDRTGIIFFFAACAASALASTLIVAAATTMLATPLSGGDILMWFLVDILGLTIFFPIFRGFGEAEWRRVADMPWRFALAIGIVIGVATIGSFTQSPVPRLVLLPALVAITFEFGIAGAVLGLGSVLFVWATFTYFGRPPGGWPEMETRGYLLLEQAYVAAVAVTVIPLAVFLAERERNSARLAAAVKEETARIEAERSNAFKSRLIAMASHDLRQPLQAAQLYIGALSTRVGEGQPQSICRSASQALDAMANILDSLLDASSIDAGIIRPRLEECVVEEILGRVAASNRPHAEAKGLSLIVQGTTCRIWSDPRLLERVIDNLVANAIRYTERGSVDVWCQCHDGSATIGVSDTGIGIAPDTLGSIFTDYVQLNNPERDRRKGLGLGLSIAQRMAALLGHQIQVKSELGKGSTFTVEASTAQPA